MGLDQRSLSNCGSDGHGAGHTAFGKMLEVRQQYQVTDKFGWFLITICGLLSHQFHDDGDQFIAQFWTETSGVWWRLTAMAQQLL